MWEVRQQIVNRAHVEPGIGLLEIDDAMRKDHTIWRQHPEGKGNRHRSGERGEYECAR